MILPPFGIGALVALSCLAAPAALGQERPETRYTRFALAPPQCTQAAGQAEGFSCRGLAGWTLDIGFPAFGASLAFVRGKKRMPVLMPLDGRTVPVDGLASQTTTVEWRGVMRKGAFEPHAAIVRVLVLGAAERQAMIESGTPAQGVKRSQVLLVTRLGQEGSCVVAYVDAQANPNPNDLAREAADAVAAGPACPVAKVEIRGAPSPALMSYMN
jgi:hypothetical protein